MRQLIVGMHLSGDGYKKIAKTTNISRSTIKAIVKKYYALGIVANLPRTGRPQLADDRLRRQIVRDVLANRRLSAESIVEQLKEFSQLKISASSVRNIIKDADLHGRSARKTPRISKVNKKKRLEYAMAHLDWTEEEWNKIVYTDESKYNLHDSDGRVFVWRRVGEEFHEDCIVTTYKSGDKGWMVWGAIGWKGVGPLHFCTENVTSTYYIEMLEEVLPSCVAMLDMDDEFQLLQDNAPAHKAKKTMAYIESYGLPTLPHPPQSPDLNPIEHMWDHVARQVRKINPQTSAALKDAIETAWYNTPVEVVQNLISSMPRRIAAVVAAKGGPTKY
jgi:transposase